MEHAVASVRAFNRFYTQLVGALEPRFLGSDLTLPEARLLFEIARAEAPVAADLQAILGMDAGHVSRVLRGFEARGLIRREIAADDARRRPIVLTAEGRRVFAGIDGRQRERVIELLKPLSGAARDDLVSALATVRVLLDPAAHPGFSIRTVRTGDMGLIAARQSRLYQAYGWSPAIDVVLGEVTTAFLRDFKPGREQGWVAEVEGVMAGAVLLTDEGDCLARLRLLHVEPFARGRGIGSALVATCIGFARETGYARMVLWTHDVLESARRIYAAQGFELVEAKVHDTFGVPVRGETWALDLGALTARKSASGRRRTQPDASPLPGSSSGPPKR